MAVKAPRPSISVHKNYVKSLAPFYVIFNNIEVLDNEFGTFRYLAPHTNVLNVTLLSANRWRDLELPELMASIEPDLFMQSYVIFEAEYNLIRAFSSNKLEELMSIHSRVRVLFCGNHNSAIAYAVGLLEKCAKNGILDVNKKLN
jgi:hypothetical protein